MRMRSRSTGMAVLFGRRLRAIRKLRQLTQENLGEKARLSGKFVGDIERGRGNPSLEVVARLAKALNLKLWELVRIEETQPHGPIQSAAHDMIAAEKVSAYLVGRPAAEVNRVVRIVEAALDEPSERRDHAKKRPRVGDLP